MDNKNKNEWYMTSFEYGSITNFDKDRGIIKDVSIVSMGEALGHGVFLDYDFMVATTKLGNDKKQGVKVRFGHPSMSSNALGTFLGRAKNFRLKTNNETGQSSVIADIFLSTSAKETPAGDLYSYIVNLAESEPDIFGLSIVFKPGETFEKVLDDKTYTTIDELTGVDFVDDPAANPNGLFSQFNSLTMAGQVTQFLDTHPQIMELLSNNPEIINNFLEKYKKYLDRKGLKMSTTDKKQVELFEATDEAIEETEAVLEEIKEVTEEIEKEVEDIAEETKEVEKEVAEVAEVEVAEVEELSTNQISDFLKFADENGYEFAKNHFGKTDIEILKIKNAMLDEENKALKSKLGTEPVEFADGDQKKNFKSIVENFKIIGLSTADAWAKASIEHKDLYQKFIKEGK